MLKKSNNEISEHRLTWNLKSRATIFKLSNVYYEFYVIIWELRLGEKRRKTNTNTNKFLFKTISRTRK